MAKSAEKWSAEVTAHDHPFDIAPGLFANSSAQQIAAALKKTRRAAATTPIAPLCRCSTSTSIAPAPSSQPRSGASFGHYRLWLGR